MAAKLGKNLVQAQATGFPVWDWLKVKASILLAMGLVKHDFRLILNDSIRLVKIWICLKLVFYRLFINFDSMFLA